MGSLIDPTRCLEFRRLGLLFSFSIRCYPEQFKDLFKCIFMNLFPKNLLFWWNYLMNLGSLLESTSLWVLVTWDFQKKLRKGFLSAGLRWEQHRIALYLKSRVIRFVLCVSGMPPPFSCMCLLHMAHVWLCLPSICQLTWSVSLGELWGPSGRQTIPSRCDFL